MFEKLKTFGNSLYIINSIDKLEKSNANLRKRTVRCARGCLFSTIGLLGLHIFLAMEVRDMKLRLDDRQENARLQEQLDAQEEKILQLELELEDLKKE